MYDVMIVNAVFTSSMSTFFTYVTRHNSIYILVLMKKNVIYIDIPVYSHIFKTKNAVFFFFFKISYIYIMELASTSPLSSKMNKEFVRYYMHSIDMSDCIGLMCFSIIIFSVILLCYFKKCL